MNRDDDIEMHRIILHLLDGKESTEEMCKYVIDLMRELSDLKKDSPGMTPGKYMIYTDIWGKCMLFCLLVGGMIIKDYPAFAFPPLRGCARCGRCLQDDECGLPCDPEHLFYNRWICDDCLDQIGDLIEEGEKEDVKMTCGEIALMLNNIMESAEIMPDYICNSENYEEGKTVVLNGVTLYGLEYALKKAIEKLMEEKENG